MLCVAHHDKPCPIRSSLGAARYQTAISQQKPSKDARGLTRAGSAARPPNRELPVETTSASLTKSGPRSMECKPSAHSWLCAAGQRTGKMRLHPGPAPSRAVRVVCDYPNTQSPSVCQAARHLRLFCSSCGAFHAQVYPSAARFCSMSCLPTQGRLCSGFPERRTALSMVRMDGTAVTARHSLRPESPGWPPED